MTRLLTWWRAAGVQTRSTTAATAVQALVVLAAGLVLLLTLQHNLDTTVDASTSATAQGLAALLDPAGIETATGGGSTTAAVTTTENGVAVRPICRKPSTPPPGDEPWSRCWETPAKSSPAVLTSPATEP